MEIPAADYRAMLAKSATEHYGITLEELAAEVGVDVSRGYNQTNLDRLALALNLMDCGQRIEDARADERQWMDFAKGYMRDCDAAGFPKAWMAKAAKVTRQTVYDALREDKR